MLDNITYLLTASAKNNIKEFELLFILILNPVLNFFLNILSSKITEIFQFRIRSAWIWLLSIITCLLLAYTVTLDKEYKNLSDIILFSIGFLLFIFIFDCIYLLIYNRKHKEINLNNSELQAQVNKLNKQINNLNKQINVLKAKIEELKNEANKNLSKDVITKREVFSYRFKQFPNNFISLVTGDIRDIDFIDAWVNSENTNMQMSRYYELSISGIIRYLGAEKDQNNHVTDDIIQNELTSLLNGASYVQPGTVIMTGAGKLEKTQNVRKIFHVASVQGQAGSGYKPIPNIERCVRNVLKKVDNLQDINTILFPIMGTGQAKGNINEISEQLIDSAINYISCNSKTKVKNIYFLIRRKSILKVCRKILDRHSDLKIETGNTD
ncbi:MAG: macro domain-containing protein [Cyanobacteria bacterium P01_D01_bin.116]